MDMWTFQLGYMDVRVEWRALAASRAAPSTHGSCCAVFLEYTTSDWLYVYCICSIFASHALILLAAAFPWKLQAAHS